MRIVFIGTAEFGSNCLTELINNEELVAIVTSPDRPSGRGLKVGYSIIKELGIKNKIEIFQPENINSEVSIKKIMSYTPDIIIIIGYGSKLCRELIDIPVFDTINVHASLLPKYRGATPIRSAIINGEKSTGITIIKIDEEIDTGSIIKQERVDIDINDDYGSLKLKLKEIAAKILIETINDYKIDKVRYKEQDNPSATYTRKMNREDYLIRWEEKSSSINNLIRGLSPSPGADTYFRRKKVKIYETSPVTFDYKIEPSVIITNDNKLYVSAEDGFLEIKELKIEGKKKISGRDFINGYRIKNGIDRFERSIN